MGEVDLEEEHNQSTRIEKAEAKKIERLRADKISSNQSDSIINPEIFLSTLLAETPSRLLFYASAGKEHGFIFGFDYDIFIFSDYINPYGKETSAIRRSGFWNRFLTSCAPHKIDVVAASKQGKIFRIDGIKWGLFLFMDNNDVVEMIKKSGHKISCFVGVWDGCGEGGNHECVNDTPFFSKIMNLIPENGMSYITNHIHFPLRNGDDLGKHRLTFDIDDSEYIGDLITEHISRWRNIIRFGQACEYQIRKQRSKEMKQG